MIIPLLPFGSFSLRVNLTLEEAIAKRGRDMKLKRDSRDGQECVAFTYRPQISLGKVRGFPREFGTLIIVTVQYQLDAVGLHINVKMMANFTALVLLFGSACLTPLSWTGEGVGLLKFLPVLFFFAISLIVWQEMVATKKSIVSLFRDHLIDDRRERVQPL